MTQEIIIQPQQNNEIQARFLPVMSVAVAVKRFKEIEEVVQKVMIEGEHFGTIPGSKKPSLFKPGAEVLCNLFGVIPKYQAVMTIEDWTGDGHSGEAFFYYRVNCGLWRGDYLMGEGEGSCNSWESKYRYRKSERVCPACGRDAIIKGNAQYGGGWLCYQKKGGCGAKFKDGDPAIETQKTGRVANPDIFDLVNTILKMANKRAQVAATLNATGASRFFTQDLEDRQPDTPPDEDPYRGTGTVAPEMRPQPKEEPRKQAQTQTTGQGAPVQQPTAKATPPVLVDPDVRALWARMNSKESSLKVFGELKASCVTVLGKEAAESSYYQVLGRYGVQHANEFKSTKPARDCAAFIFTRLREIQDEKTKELEQQDDAPPVAEEVWEEPK